MLIIGLSGTTLTDGERDWTAHRAVSGVILFSRNFADRAQVTRLIADMRVAAARPLLVTVDQEGGPVQRLRDGFTRLPELARFGAEHARDADSACAGARTHAWLMASEMRAIDVDLSFAPVVDLGRGNRAIGERAFDADPHVVAKLARAYIDGMHAAGMAATLKHFPGHGSIAGDTHHEAVDDARTLDAMMAEDLVPFAAGIDAGAEAVMMAHVRYPMVDDDPAGYSAFWIGDVLRRRMRFAGIVISDDIGMAAAFGAGGVAARIDAHRRAGCDLVLACHPSVVPEALAACDGIDADPRAVAPLLGRARHDWDTLLADERWREARASLGADDHTVA